MGKLSGGLTMRNIANDEPSSADFRDTTEFKEYCQSIAKVLPVRKPVPIRYVHTKLGKQARREWTMDALFEVAEIHYGYIDKFTKRMSL